ncbi:MAG: peptidase MA family metallohydrolase [Planctomycetota bacterium]
MKSILNKTIIFILLDLALLPLVAYPAAGTCKYNMSVTISQRQSTVDTTTHLVYHNDSPKTLHELVFHFNGPRNNISAISNSRQSLQIAPFVDIAGKTLEDYFVVKLVRPLRAGKSIGLKIKSKNQILDRYGIKHLEGCWHPKIVKYTDGQWKISVEDFADYRVIIGPIAQSLIPSSGKVIRRQKDKNGLWTLTLKASNIPDFGIVLSHADHVVSETQDNITINCFYLQDKDIAERMLNTAKDVIHFYRKMYGFYPDTLLNIIAFDGRGFGGGPIGSNIVHVNKTFEQNEDNTIWAIAHEIAHEYWGWNWVKDANPEVAWLCLGMGLWSDLQYMKAQNKEGQNYNILDDYYDALKHGLNTKLENLTTKDMQNRMNENSLAHSKGYMIALMLEYLVGEDCFYEIARTTLERFGHQIITTKKFQSICEEISKQKLDWFFQQWVYTNHTLDYGIADVSSTQVNSKQQITVSIKRKGLALMPVDVLLESMDGSISCQRVPYSEALCTFTSDKTWRRIVVDPNNYLPDTNRSNNIKINPQVKLVFEILDVDLGDKAWGLNLLRVHVKNTTAQQRCIKVHIGVGKRRGSSGLGFGMGEFYKIAANDDQWIEHWYWLPPSHGIIDAIVRFTDVIGEGGDTTQSPFLTKEYEINFAIPNDRCNNLTITEKRLEFQKFYPDVKHLEPFEYFTTEHFVFYCSPNTLAYKDVKKLMSQHESALRKVCDFVEISPIQVITIFFYPDQTTKKMCTLHTGNGLARGNMIAEVYNEETKLDPHHELTHVIMGQIGDPPALFNEGLAVYMQTGHIWNDQHVDKTAIDLLESGKLISLSKLITRTEIGSQNDDGEIAYPASASFVKFLIDNYGKERFINAYKELKNNDHSVDIKKNISRMKGLFGHSLDGLEKQWHNFLSNAN